MQSNIGFDTVGTRHTNTRLCLHVDSNGEKKYREIRDDFDDDEKHSTTAHGLNEKFSRRNREGTYSRYSTFTLYFCFCFVLLISCEWDSRYVTIFPK